MKEKELEKGNCWLPTRKVRFWDFVGPEPQPVADHLADESQTRWLDTPPDHPQDGPEHFPVVYPANAFHSHLRGV